MTTTSATPVSTATATVMTGTGKEKSRKENHKGKGGGPKRWKRDFGKGKKGKPHHRKNNASGEEGGKRKAKWKESVVYEPHVARLLKEVLAWDYLDLLLKERKKAKTVLDFQKKLKKVPLKFADAESFENCFEPLLLEECRAEMVIGWSEDWYLKFMSELRGTRDMNLGTATDRARARAFENHEDGDGNGEGEGECSTIFRRLTLGIDKSAKNLGSVREKRNEKKDYMNEEFFCPNDLVLLSQKDPDDKEAHKALYFLGFVDKVQDLRKSKDVEEEVIEVVDDDEAEAEADADKDQVMEDADAGPQEGEGADHHNKKSNNEKTKKKKLKEEEKGVQMIILQSGHQKQNKIDESLASEISEAVKSGKGTWVLSRLCNLTTTIREYQALFKVRGTKFERLLFDPTTANAQNALIHKLALPDRLSASLSKRYTESQMEALKSALTGDKLILIQGPPGTGKTNTICGLLSVLANSMLAENCAGHPAFTLPARDGFDKQLPQEDVLRHWRKASPWITTCDPRNIPGRDTQGKFLAVPQAKQRIMKKAKPRQKPKILVCAPSNSALDEIILRLMDLLMIDEIGLQYMPRIVRLGALVKASPGIEPYLLRTLQKKYPKIADEDIVRGAEIVFSTLSNSGARYVQEWDLKFDYVIIDEAAQAVEPSTLIPLSFGCDTCFLVGDPKQLPATIMSIESVKTCGYNQSLFKRLESCDYPVQLLTTQFRMHPEIRKFPSTQFYGGRLVDSAHAREEREREWHEDSRFGPFAFYNINYTKGAYDRYTNKAQAQFAIDFVDTLTSTFSDLKNQDIGIIGTYRAQTILLENMLVDTFGKEKGAEIEVRTVDSFQGREKDVVIWTTVRSDVTGAIGFLKDDNRINVALTRAKSTMIVVGNAKALTQSKHKTWKDLIEYAQGRNVYYQHKEFEKVEFKPSSQPSAKRSRKA